MQNQKENPFQSKFHLLNSQEHTEEIIWSLSDSSEYEEPAANEKLINITNRTRTLKRKRKKNVPNNLSNLSVTVIDTSKCSKEAQSGETSPILISKKHQKSFNLSPILAPTQAYRQPTSPVLPSRSIKSPILTPKINSPKTTAKIKKKLFDKKCEYLQDAIIVKTEVESDCDVEDNIIMTCQSLMPDPTVKVKEETSQAKLELVSKVKSFFDNHFSSESSTQTSDSISEIHTQNYKSDELEILSCKTHSGSSNNINTVKQENLSNQSSDNYYTLNNSKKKNRYKKNGLAYRLNNILRRQNSCLSLWHHERFLAANSNFIIPKGEYSVFRIQKVNFQYGCFLLDAVDLDEEDYLILINSCYVSDNIKCDIIIKVYEPFKMVPLKDIKLLINVCRFECSQYKA